MKSAENLIEQLNALPHFDKMTISQLGKQLGIANTTVDTYISRFLKRREIIHLKKGLYISADYFNKNKDDISYSFYLANILRKPSYVSSWAALQYYNLTTESIFPITSITPKVTRTYKTKAGTFAYQSIKKDFFTGFSLVKGEPSAFIGKFDFFIATPSKALFDLIYFRTNQFRSIRFEDINILIEELRIDIDEMHKRERNIFYSIVRERYE